MVIKVAYSKKALSDLRKIPANDSRRVRTKITEYAANPDAQAQHVKKLKGREGYRLRVGKWRVIFDMDGNVLAVLRVAARGNVYS